MKQVLGLLFVLALLVTACLPGVGEGDLTSDASTLVPFYGPSPTPLPTRTEYDPGELVDYVAQNGDTLPALAAHFNSRVDEIREANPQIPQDATTMPPGMPMKIPIYYWSLWGTPFKILPDSLFILGPSTRDFDTTAFVERQPGWLKDYSEYAGDRRRTGAEIVDYVALNFSVSPRILLALLEYQTGALSSPIPPIAVYPLGYQDFGHPGIYLQLVWAANVLNNGYYGWRAGRLSSFEHPDGRLERPDPWQNAATVAFQYYFSRVQSAEQYEWAVSPAGIAQSYANIFGDPWQADVPHFPASLQQPQMRLPFNLGETWTYTGGPHSSWGEGEPLAAIDFGPPLKIGGCEVSDRWIIAVADGLVVRSETGLVVLDLDHDGDERTGWVIFYRHVGTIGRVPVGASLKAGDRIGHPSCEGGEATGTHLHITRKYNGEWIPADGALAFNLEGWIAHNGGQPYQGTLTRNYKTIIACDCSNLTSQIQAGIP